MEKEENYSASTPSNFSTGLDYTIDHHHDHHHQTHVGETSTNHDNNDGIVNYLLSNNQQRQQPNNFCGSNSFDKLSFADVMQFADFGPKLALNQAKISNYEESGMDPVYFLKFPVLNDKFEDQSLNILTNPSESGNFSHHEEIRYRAVGREDEEARVWGNNNNSSLAHMQLQYLGDEDNLNKKNLNAISEPAKNNNKRKRPRTIKTTEEVESQRMTHIAVERNRRKQMNEHLRVLRSLMPGSYVQRGDQASIIGGAIEFVRELEQLLQCLESQKRRRLVGDQEPARVFQIGGTDSANNNIAVVPGIEQPDHQLVPYFPVATLPLPSDQIKFLDFETGHREEIAENKSCLADVEVKLLGFDAIIKILSRRRPGQLIKTIAALEDLQFNILHTNITTIEQTVLYSFNVKVVGETRFSAEDIANSVQQIYSFIHANSTM